MNNYSDYRDYYMMNQTPNMNDSNQNNFKPTNPSGNLNFNQCGYDQKNVNPNQLYDPYQGFIRGNMFPDIYNTYKVKRPFDIQPMNEQAKLLTYIDSLQFAAHDLNLYLDTHPNNRDMIQLFNQYRKETEKAIQEYEKQYGPLFVMSDALNTAPWAWNQLPWPWENR